MADVNVNLSFTADTSKAQAAIKQLQQTLLSLSSAGSGKGVSKEMQQASAAAKELSFHLNQAFNAKTGDFDLSRLNTSLKNSGTSIDQLSIKLLGAGKTGQQAFTQLSTTIANANRPVVNLGTHIKDLWKTMQNTMKWQLSSSMLHGFIGAIQEAKGYAEDLNKSLTNISIVTGSNISQMKDFAKEANEAAQRLSTTTTAYTDASLIFFQQGLGEKEVKERTDATIKLANVTGQSTDEIASQLTAIWNNYADGSKNLEYYADVITKLGAATASSSAEISDGLQKFASIGETVGLSYEYATAALATVVAETRQSAETVGTAFKTMFARIQGLKLGETLEDGTTMNQYSEALKTIGVDIKTANGDLKDMDVILDEMGAKWKELNRDEQVAVAQKVAGVRQYSQLISLMNNYDIFKGNVDLAAGSEGTLEEQQKQYEQGWEAAQKRVKAGFQSIYTEVFNDQIFIKFNNVLGDILGGVKGLIDGFGGLGPIISGVGSILLGVFAHRVPDALQNLRANLMVIFKGASRQAQEMGEEMIRTFDTLKNSNMFNGLESSTKMQLEANEQLIIAKNKLLAVQNSLSEKELQESNFTLTIAEGYQQEIQALSQSIDKKQELIASTADSINIEEAEIEILKVLDEQRRAGVQDIRNQNDLLLTQTEDYLTELSHKYVEFLEAQHNGLKMDNLSLDNFEIFKTLELSIDNITAKLNATPINSEGFQSIRSEALTLARTFDDLTGGSIPKLNNAIRQLEQSEPKNLVSNWNNFIQVVKNAQIPAEKLNSILKYLGQNTTVRQLGKEFTSLAKDIDTARKKQEELNNLVKKFNPEHIATKMENITKTAAGLGNVAMALSSIRSIMKAFSSDTDMSFGERLSQAFMGISMLIPSLVAGYQNLGVGIDGVRTKLLSKIGAQLTSNAVDEASAASAASVVAANEAEAASTESVVFAEEAEVAASAEEVAANTAQTASEEQQVATKGKLIAVDFAKKEVVQEETEAELAGAAAAGTNATAQEAETAAKVEGAAASGVDAAGEVVDTGAKGANIVVTRLLTIAQKLLNKELLATIGIMAAVGLVVGLAGKGISKLKEQYQEWKQAKEDAYNADKIAAENARTQEEEVAKNYDSMKTAYENFVKEVNNYQDARNGLDSLIQGTVEYREQLIKVNEAASNLITIFGDLEYSVNKDGLIVIDDKSLALAQDRLLTIQEDALIAKQTAESISKIKTSKSNQTDLIRNKLTSSIEDEKVSVGENVVSGIAGGASLGATGGAALGAASLGVFSAPLAVVGGIGGAIIGGIDSYFKSKKYNESVEERSNDLEKKALDAIQLAYQNQGSSVFDKDTLTSILSNVDINDETLVNSLLANQSAVEANINALNNNTQALIDKVKPANDKGIKDRAEKLGINPDSAAIEGVSNLVATGAASASQDIDSIDPEEAQKFYAQQHGLTYEWGQSSEGNRTYYGVPNENGEPQQGVTVSDAEAQLYYAQHIGATDFSGIVTVLSGALEAAMNNQANNPNSNPEEALEAYEGVIGPLQEILGRATSGDASDRYNASIDLMLTMSQKIADYYNNLDKESGNLGDLLVDMVTGGKTSLESLTGAQLGILQNNMATENGSLYSALLNGLQVSSQVMRGQTPDFNQPFSASFSSYMGSYDQNIPKAFKDLPKIIQDAFSNMAGETIEQYSARTGKTDDIEAEKFYLKKQQAGQKTFNSKFADKLRSFYDGLSDEQKTLLLNIDFDKNQTIEQIQSALDLAQAEAEQKPIKAKLTNVETAEGALKENMTSEDWTTIQNNVDWGENGIVEYADFLAMTFQEKQEYLQSLKQTYLELDTETTSQVLESAQQLYNETLEAYNIGSIDELLSKKAKLEEAKKSASGTEERQQIDSYLAEIDSKIQYLEELQGKINDARIKLDENFRKEATSLGIDPDEVDQLSKIIQKTAKDSDKLADSLANNEVAAKKAALSQLKMEKGLKDLKEVLTNAKTALKDSNKGTLEYEQNLSKVKKAMNQVLGLDLDEALGESADAFLANAENMKLMEKAAKGDVDAVEQLMKNAGKQIILNIKTNHPEVQSELQALQDEINQMDLQDIEIGMSLEEAGLMDIYDKLTGLVEAGALTADQMNAALATIGWEPNIEWITVDKATYDAAMAESQSTITLDGQGDASDVSQTYTISTKDQVKTNDDGTVSIPVISPKNTTFKGVAGNYGLGNGRACFEAGTLVSTIYGFKNIENIQVGDIVLSYNETTKQNEYSEVLQTMIHDVKENIYRLYIENEILTVTGIHRFLILRDNLQSWIHAEDLVVGDKVLFADGTLHEISGIMVKKEIMRVYNFEVSKNHNYYVGQNQILAHNKGSGGCFVAGTLISEINGLKPIEEIKKDDIVLSYNEKTKQNEYSKVLQTMIHIMKENIYSLFIEDDILNVTGIHRFLILRNNQQSWIAAESLQTGDQVLFANGKWHYIQQILTKEQFVIVYNFEVSKNHNYYVGKNQILAHNKGGGCFEAGTLISKDTGFESIENIKVGDIVLSYNEKTKKNEYSEVADTMIHIIKDTIYSLYIEDDILHTTSIHKFLIIENRLSRWIQAQYLKVGDSVLFSDGTIHKIQKIETEEKFIVVYNFEVENNHNYYVGYNQILAHNKGGSTTKPAKKERAPKRTDTVDRYKEINDKLKVVNRNLDKYNTLTDAAYGKNKLKGMQQILEAYRDQIKLQQKLIKEAENYAKIDKQNLEDAAKELKVTLKYDEDGNVSNIESVQNSMADKIDSLYAKYNSFSTAEEQSTFKEETMEPYTEQVSHFKDMLSQYEETLDKIAEAKQEKLNLSIEQMNKRLEAKKYKIQLRFDVREREINLFTRELTKLEKAAFTTGRQLALMNAQVRATKDESTALTKGVRDLLANGIYKEVDGKVKTLKQIYKNDKAGLKAILNDLMETGGSDKFWEEWKINADTIEDLNEYADKALDLSDSLDEVIEKMTNMIPNIYDRILEKTDKLVSKMDTLINRYSTWMEIIELLGKEWLFKNGDGGYDDSFMKILRANSNQNAIDQVKGARASENLAVTAWEAGVKNQPTQEKVIDDQIDNLKDERTNALKDTELYASKKRWNKKHPGKEMTGYQYRDWLEDTYLSAREKERKDWADRIKELEDKGKKRTNAETKELSQLYKKTEKSLEKSKKASEWIAEWDQVLDTYDSKIQQQEQKKTDIANNVQDLENQMEEAKNFTVETLMEALQTIIENAASTLQDVRKQYEDLMADGYHNIQDMQDAMARNKKISEQYLGDYEKVYELTKLNRDLEKKMDETTNLKTKQQLAEYQKKILDYAREGVKMSKYDLEYMQKEYDLEVAKIALEEAQNAKTQVRLTRDAEGNYSYTYTADESKTAEAQQTYENKLNEIVKLSNDYQEQMLESELALKQERLDSLAELDEALARHQITEQEYGEKVAALEKYYTEQSVYFARERDNAARNNTYVLMNELAPYYDITEKKIGISNKFNETEVKNFNAAKERLEQARRDREASLTEIENQLAAGKISAEKYEAKLAEINSKYTKETAAAETMIKTTMTNIEQNMDGVTTYAEDKFLPEYSDTWRSASELNQEFEEKFELWRTDVKGVLDGSEQDLKDTVKAAGISLDESKDMWEQVGLYIAKENKDIRDEISSTEKGLENAVDNGQDELTEASNDLDTWWKKTYPILTAAQTALQTVADKILGIQTAAAGLDTITVNTDTAEAEANLNSIIKKLNAIKKKQKALETNSGGKGDPNDGDDDTGGGKGGTGGGNTGLTDKQKLTIAKKIAASIWGGKGAGNWETGHNREQKINQVFGNKAYNYIQPLITKWIKSGEINSIVDQYLKYDWSWDKMKQYAGSDKYKFDTGGYTGAWGLDGRWALLHQKELVLNAKDTENMLAAVKTVREIAAMVDLQAQNASLAGQYALAIGQLTGARNAQSLDQNVHITAEFPNVQDHNEIEMALTSLVNRASQYAWHN